MRGGVRGLVVGVLGLTALYNLVTISNSASTGLNTLTNMPGKVARWLISPDVPLIPDRRTSSSSAGSSNGGTRPAPASFPTQLLQPQYVASTQNAQTQSTQPTLITT